MEQNGYDSLKREYSRIAARYDARWKFYVEASIRETLRRLPVVPGDRVLDVGCGTGTMLEALALAVPEAGLAGIDLSREMIDIGRSRLGVAADLRQACAEALPFGDAEFDVVISTSAFHFIRNPVAALREISRVSKPFGRVVITDWCADYLSCRVFDLFLRAFNRGHFRTYGSEECRELFVKAGFENVEVERYKISWFWGVMTATATKDATRQQPAVDGDDVER